MKFLGDGYKNIKLNEYDGCCLQMFCVLNETELCYCHRSVFFYFNVADVGIYFSQTVVTLVTTDLIPLLT